MEWYPINAVSFGCGRLDHSNRQPVVHESSQAVKRSSSSCCCCCCAPAAPPPPISPPISPPIPPIPRRRRQSRSRHRYRRRRVSHIMPTQRAQNTSLSTMARYLRQPASGRGTKNGADAIVCSCCWSAWRERLLPTLAFLGGAGDVSDDLLRRQYPPPAEGGNGVGGAPAAASECLKSPTRGSVARDARPRRSSGDSESPPSLQGGRERRERGSPRRLRCGCPATQGAVFFGTRRGQERHR